MLGDELGVAIECSPLRVRVLLSKPWMFEADMSLCSRGFLIEGGSNG
jgi:hypothetical protein